MTAAEEIIRDKEELATLMQKEAGLSGQLDLLNQDILSKAGVEFVDDVLPVLMSLEKEQLGYEKELEDIKAEAEERIGTMEDGRINQ